MPRYIRPRGTYVTPCHEVGGETKYLAELTDISPREIWVIAQALS